MSATKLLQLNEGAILADLRRTAKALIGWAPRWMDVDDLISIGWLGYVRASERVTPERSFLTFGHSWARAEMKSAIRSWYGGDRHSPSSLFRAMADEYEKLIGDAVVAKEDDDDLDDRFLREIQEDSLINSTLARLPPEQEIAIRLCYLDLCTPTEASKLLYCSPSAVSGRVRSGMIRLRKLVQEAA